MDQENYIMETKTRYIMRRSSNQMHDDLKRKDGLSTFPKKTRHMSVSGVNPESILQYCLLHWRREIFKSAFFEINCTIVTN